MNTNASSMGPECFAFLEPEGYCTRCEKVTGTSHPDTQAESDSGSTSFAPRPKRIENKPEKETRFFKTASGAGCLSLITFVTVFCLAATGASTPSSHSNSGWVPYFSLLGSIQTLVMAGLIAAVVSIVLFFILIALGKSRE
jgi:hypothetical protein